MGYTVCNKVKVMPRAGSFGSANTGSKIFGSNTSPTADLVELGTFGTVADEGFTTLTFSNTTGYKYLIYKIYAANGQVAELEFYNGSTKITPVATFGAAAFDNDATYNKDKAFDGNSATMFVSAAVNPIYLAIEAPSDAPADTTRPNDVTLGAVTNGASGVSIAFTPATDNSGGSGIAKLKLFRSTDNFATETLIDNVPNTSPFLDTNAPQGVSVKYEAVAVDNAALESLNRSNRVTGQRWNAAPTFTTDANLGNVNINQSTDFTLATTGGDGTRIIALQSGQSFPTGVSLNGNTLTINRGTTGAINILLKVTDANGQTSNRTFTATLVDPNAVPPTANFTIPASVQINTNFQPDNTSTGATSYIWYKRVANTGNYTQFSTAAAPTISFDALGTYQIKLKAVNANGETEIVKIITASNLATIELCIQYPLKKEPIYTQTIFPKINGEEDVVKDAPTRWRYFPRIIWHKDEQREALEEFLAAHEDRQPFNWYDPGRKITRTVKMVGPYSAEEMYYYGGFEIILEDAS